MSLLAAGEGVGKVIGIISLPLITRIYSPEDMGILSLYNSVVMILVPFGTLKYSNAIILPKTDEYALNLSVLSFLVNLIFLLVVFSILALFGELLFDLFTINDIAQYWWLIGVSVFLINTYDILYNWNLRKNNYKLIAKTKSFQSICGEFAKVVLGLLGLRPLGLLLGAVFSRSGGISTLFSKYKLDLARNINRVSFRRIKFLFLYYRDFPQFRLTSYFLFVSSTQLIPIIVTSLYGTAINGQAGLAIMVLGIPITLIGNSIGQAYYNEISKIKNYGSNELFEVTLSIAKKLSAISLLPFLVIFLFARPIFVICFGEEWGQAGEFCSILSFYLVTQFIAAPLMNALVVLRKQDKTLFIHGFRLISILVISYISYLFKLDVKVFLLIYSIFLSLHYVFVVLKLFSLIKNEKIKRSS